MSYLESTYVAEDQEEVRSKLRTKADGTGGMDFGQGLILAPNTAIVVEYDTGTGGLCEINCLMHFEAVGFS